MLLEETLTADAVRAAHDRQRPADDVRQHSIGAGDVILGQLALGNPFIRIVDSVRMSQLDPFDGDLATVALYATRSSSALRSLRPRRRGFPFGAATGNARAVSFVTSSAGLSSRSP